MTWVLEQIVSEIYEAYEQLPGGRDPIGRDEKDRPIFGTIAKGRNADVPRIVWVLKNGNFGNPSLSASAPPADAKAPPEQPSPHYQALARFNVWIWQVDNETCWNVMVDLLAAMRATVYGPNLGPQNFEFPTEIEPGGDTERGAVVILDVVISVPIPRDGTVPIEEVEIGTTTSDVRTRGDLLALQVTPPPDPDLDFIVVTDP